MVGFRRHDRGAYLSTGLKYPGPCSRPGHSGQLLRGERPRPHSLSLSLLSRIIAAYSRQCYHSTRPADARRAPVLVGQVVRLGRTVCARTRAFTAAYIHPSALQGAWGRFYAVGPGTAFLAL